MGRPCGSRSLEAASSDNANATSSTRRAKKPTWSSDGLKGCTPVRGIAPKLGLKPTTPLNAAGLMIEPSVCVPSASGTSPAATAAAEPDDEPPGVCFGFHGLTVGPGWRQANSVETVLPKIVAPRLRSRSTTHASATGMQSL